MLGVVSRKASLALVLFLFASGCAGTGPGQANLAGEAPGAGTAPDGATESSDGGVVTNAPAIPATLASVTYPFLIADPDGTVDYFPTVFAHLLGQPLTWTDISTSLACITLKNTGDEPFAGTVRVELTGYSTPLVQSVSVAAHASAQSCVNPTPSLDALYGLTAPVPGQVHTTVTSDGSDAPILDDVHAVTITTGETVFDRRWPSDGSYVSLYKYQAVLSMPKDPQVQALLAPAAARSAWGTFGIGGYGMHLDASGNPLPRNPVTVAVASGGIQVDQAYFLAGESITLNIDGVACAACSEPAIDLYMLDATEFGDVAPGSPGNGIGQSVVAVPAAAASKQLTFTAPAEGVYYFVFSNDPAAGGLRSVTYHRTGTQADTVVDAMQAVYGELQSWGITYVNVAFSFFDPSWTESVRWPATVLADHAANCIDGSMLFASVLEALRLEPVVVFIPEHAFMGVRQSPGSARVWPVETTMLGTAPFAAALAEGIDEYLNPAIVHLDEMDIKAARLAGLTPIPE